MTRQHDLPITILLSRWRAGDRSIEQPLLAEIYPILRDIARAQIRRNGGAMTLEATDLANEVYEKLFLGQNADWKNRDHFYAIAATVIRRVVLDHVRSRGREKRGGGVKFVELEAAGETPAPVIDESFDWIALDAALTELAAFNPACARVVELKFFSGLTTERIAEVEEISVATVGRQWRFARAWLAQRMGIDTVESGG